MSSTPLDSNPVQLDAIDAPIDVAPTRPATRWLTVIVPVVSIALGVIGAATLVALRPTADKTPHEVLPPLVRTRVVELSSQRLYIETQGSVAPRTESDLVAEVPGRVIWVSPALVAGGFFEQDEPLARIDARDYEVAVTLAQAQLSQRRSEAQLAQRNLDRSGKLFENNVSSDAIRDEAKNAAAVTAAAVTAARANLDKAHIDLERTTLRAPYDGRVRKASVDLGEYVGPGAPLATVYAIDSAEVRLPIPDEDLAPLGLGIDFETRDGSTAGAPVTLRAQLGGRSLSWPAQVVRTEGALDLQTRMVTVVARVDDPYARRGASHEAPLPVGLFVTARIEGRALDDAIVLPRSALRGFDRVLVVDDDDRLRFREVEVVHRRSDEVVIGAGLEPGERVCLSSLEAVTDGMRVRVASPNGTRS